MRPADAFGEHAAAALAHFEGGAVASAAVSALSALRLVVGLCPDSPVPGRLVVAALAELDAAALGTTRKGLVAADVARELGMGVSTARDLLSRLEGEGGWGVYHGKRNALTIPPDDFARWRAIEGREGSGARPPASEPPAARSRPRSDDPHDLLGRGRPRAPAR